MPIQSVSDVSRGKLILIAGDFHLVDPSPWPIYVSFATLVLAFGAVYYFHSKALWLLLVGLALVIYGAFMWWRDVIEEAEHQGHHTPIVQIGHLNRELDLEVGMDYQNLPPVLKAHRSISQHRE